MWIVLISNWKTILGVVATTALGYLLHSLDVDRLQLQQQQALEAQAQSMTKQCDAEKQVTKEVSDDYQKKLSDVSSELARAKRMRPATCVPVSTSSPPDGRNETPGANQPVGTHGIPASTLLDFAAEAEQYRLQLIACQDFVNKSWALNDLSSK